MAKQPKLRISLLSFQFCRPTKSSVLPNDPIPLAAYKLSSLVNSRSFDVLYPDFPSPPPSTPNQSFRKCHVTSEISSVDGGSCAMHVTSKCKGETSSPAYYKMKKVETTMHEPRVSRFGRQGQKDNITTKKSQGSVSKSISSSPRLSDLPYESDYRPLKAKIEGPSNEKKKMKQKSVKSQRFNNCTSNNGKDVYKTLPESEPRVKKSVRMVGGKVKESFVVEKRSVDPYKDFKKSMLEMILEKQIFDAKDLDELVLYFLSLNSHQYHSVILKVFVEIWEELFGGAGN